MIALIDFDSVLYHATYRVVSFSQIREKLRTMPKENARQWLMEEVYNEGINRCENQLLKMQNYVQEIFFEEIKSFEIYLTTCTNSFRKELSKTYKSKRKHNKYVWLLREHYKMNGAKHSYIYEADDLISERAKGLGKGNYVIFSVDKDLKQIGGYLWSYYKVKSYDMHGNPVFNDLGLQESEYRQKTVEYISDEKADHLFWKQMLMGDSSDNIKGIYRIGDKKSDSILSKSKNHFITTARIYISKGQKDDFWINYKLIKLGTTN